VGADVREPGLDLGDPVGLGGELGVGEELRALAVGRQHDLEQAVGPVRRLLGQPVDAAARRLLHLPVLGRKLAGDHAEQGGLAGTVAAHQPDPGPGRNMRAGALEQKPAGHAHRELVDDEH
jgi:hypothetical protein